jgi:predicted amidophosphoribosyltransferase
MLICDKCNAKINQESKFCPQCGDPVDHKDIVVKIAMLTEYKDEEPIRIGKKAEKEETAE